MCINPEDEQQVVSSIFALFQTKLEEFCQKYTKEVTYSIILRYIHSELIRHIDDIRQESTTCIAEIDNVHNETRFKEIGPRGSRKTTVFPYREDFTPSTNDIWISWTFRQHYSINTVCYKRSYPFCSKCFVDFPNFLSEVYDRFQQLQKEGCGMRKLSVVSSSYSNC